MGEGIESWDIEQPCPKSPRKSVVGNDSIPGLFDFETCLDGLEGQAEDKSHMMSLPCGI